MALLLPLKTRAQNAKSAPPTTEPVRLLTIGNSFADNATTYLPKMASSAGKNLFVFRANLGGHSFEQHVNYFRAYEANPADPKGSPYANRFPKAEKRKLSLKEILEGAKWDYVTIQQYSRLSYKPESYEPYAGTLIAAIRKYAPQAKILVHETWAYQADHPLFKEENFTPEEMHRRLHEAYAGLAERYGLEVIPVGCAFALAAQTPEWRYEIDPAFDPATSPAEALPKPGGLHNGWRWVPNRPQKASQKRRAKDSEPPDPRGGKFELDGTHANPAGCYLGGRVFLHTLFPDVKAVPFVPKGLSAEQAQSLGTIALKTVATVEEKAAKATPAASAAR